MGGGTATGGVLLYRGPDEIETESYILLFPDTFTNGRVIKEKIEGRVGINYRDTKTGRFISKKGLLRIVKED